MALDGPPCKHSLFYLLLLYFKKRLCLTLAGCGYGRSSTWTMAGIPYYFAGNHACFSRGAFPKARLLSQKQHGCRTCRINSWDVIESLILLTDLFYCLSHLSLYLIKMSRVRATPRRSFLQSFVACKSSSASDRLQREFELGNRDAPDSFKGTAFAASKRGSFFQEAPRLRNQFSGDLFLQSYLKRVIPQEVGMCSIQYGQLLQYKSV